MPGVRHLGDKTEKVVSRTPGLGHQWVWAGWAATGQFQLVPVQGAERDPSHALEGGGQVQRAWSELFPWRSTALSQQPRSGAPLVAVRAPEL